MGRRSKRPAQPLEAFDERPGREERRRQRREAGNRTAELAHRLLNLPRAGFRKLEIDGALLEELAAARKITAQGARRREERRLAGLLRLREDLDALEQALEAVEERRRYDS